jgi:hypothetical protein
VRRSPVSFFTTPHELATQVTVSFVNLRDRRPAVGFIRANQAPDLKKYADLLEENARLKADLSKLEGASVSPFPQASETVYFTVEQRIVTPGVGMQPYGTHQASLTLGEIFVSIGDDILGHVSVGEGIISKISEGKPSHEIWHLRGDELHRLCLRLYGFGLLRNIGPGQWVLTDYGQKQYGLLMP